MKKLYLLIIHILLPCAVYGQSKQIARPDGTPLFPLLIDSIVTKLMGTAHVTGLGLGIVYNNRIVYIKSYGYKNKAKQELNDTTTCFYAASLAKPLFAYLVMQLVDQGLIDLDKPLCTYLPKPLPRYKDYTDLADDDRWKLITARECLDHSTGFPNWRQFNPHGNKKLEIFFTPGKRFAYSGEGIYLLQLVIETITGKDLETLAAEQIFKPFGMTRTSFLWQPAFETDYAYGHGKKEKPLAKNKRKSANAAGSMETTIADYTRFMAAVMQQKAISANAAKEMFSPQIIIHSKREFPSLNSDTTTENENIGLSYGLGWGLFSTPYGEAFFKEGHDEGWEHYVIGFPDKQMALVIMSNSANGERIFKGLVEQITDVVIPWKWEGYIPY